MQVYGDKEKDKHERTKKSMGTESEVEVESLFRKHKGGLKKSSQT